MLVTCFFGLVFWVLGQGALEIGPVGRWVSPTLVRVVSFGSGVLLASVGALAFVVVSRKPEPLAQEYDRYTIGMGGLPFNRDTQPRPSTDTTPPADTPQQPSG